MLSRDRLNGRWIDDVTSSSADPGLTLGAPRSLNNFSRSFWSFWNWSRIWMFSVLTRLSLSFRSLMIRL